MHSHNFHVLSRMIAFNKRRYTVALSINEASR